ncbi:hypothetical protein SALBM311S_12957 [Streptomyces alboniger]
MPDRPYDPHRRTSPGRAASAESAAPPRDWNRGPTELGVNRPNSPWDKAVGQPFRISRPNPTANSVGGTWKESPPLASHRKSRPAGTRVAGIRTPALATAALTSVALLSQSAQAVPADDKPSLEEVEQKVDDLYRQAESATDNYNAAKEKTGKQRKRVDTLLEDVAQRTQKLNEARRSWVPSPPPSTAPVPPRPTPRPSCSRTPRRTTSTRPS